MKSFSIIIFSILLSCNILNAQWISGNITLGNDKKPARDAVVKIKDTNKNTIADVDGNYRIKIDSSHTTLVFLFSDYKAQEINIENDSVINVTLKEDEILLNCIRLGAIVRYEIRVRMEEDTIRVKRFGVTLKKIHKQRKYEKRCYMLRVEKFWVGDRKSVV